MSGANTSFEDDIISDRSEIRKSNQQRIDGEEDARQQRKNDNSINELEDGPNKQKGDGKQLPVFEIHKHNARELCPILRALMFRDHGSMTVCQEGIRVVVDDQHNESGSAYFKYDQFAEFILRVPTVNLRIPLGPLTETLNVFNGNNTMLQMTYAGQGEPLNVIVEDEGTVFRCQINTQIPQPVLDFEFNPSNVVCKVIMVPTSVRDIIRDLDQSSPTVHLIITQNYISFYTNGDLGRIKTQISGQSEHIELLECLEDRVSHQYRLTLVRRMLASFSQCNKVSLRIDRRGVLSSQFLVPQTDQQTVFVEFFTVADNDVYYD